MSLSTFYIFIWGNEVLLSGYFQKSYKFFWISHQCSKILNSSFFEHVHKHTHEKFSFLQTVIISLYHLLTYKFQINTMTFSSTFHNNFLTLKSIFIGKINFFCNRLVKKFVNILIEMRSRAIFRELILMPIFRNIYKLKMKVYMLQKRCEWLRFIMKIFH